MARWFAVAVVGLNAIGQMFFIPAYPFWSLLIIAIDIVALWGCACTAAARTSVWPSAAVAPGHAVDGTKLSTGSAEPGKEPGTPE